MFCRLHTSQFSSPTLEIKNVLKHKLHVYITLNPLLNTKLFSADMTHKFLNENWSMIMQDIASPAVKEIVKACVEKVKKFYAQVPAAELLQ